mgnify:CR=1 FL=1
MAKTSPQSIDAVAKTYARAWFELALQHDRVDEAADEADQLAALFADNADFRRLFENPAIDIDARASLIERLFNDRVSDLTARFLRVVNRHGRSSRLPSILMAFRQRVDAHHGIVAATATVADALPEDRVAEIAEGLGKSLGDKTVRLEQRVDASVIGGLRLRVGDQLLDASVASQLRTIESKLREQGREKARQAVASQS